MGVFKKQGVYWIDHYIDGHHKQWASKTTIGVAKPHLMQRQTTFPFLTDF
jgi:hypothetical protein